MNGNRILADGVTVSDDTRLTQLNNNDMIIGASGSGKTQGYVIPNLLRCESSAIVVDPKGDLHRKLTPELERRGIDTRLIDLTDGAHSPWGYNPLAHIRRDKAAGTVNDQDIMSLAAALCPIENDRDPFWDLASRMQMGMLIGYTLETLPAREQHLGSIARLLSQLGGSATQALLEEQAFAHPESFTAAKWRTVRTGMDSDRMQSSIQGIMSEKLDPFTHAAPMALFTNPRQINLTDLAEKPTVLFITTSDTDRSQDKLATQLFTQALQELCRHADAQRERCLAVPVRLYLDDFAASATIPDFDATISVIRSRGISVSIILQSLSQLEALYGPSRARTIINNCDHCLYLGGQDVDTAAYIAAKANVTTEEILALPLDRSWVFERGRAPRLVHKVNASARMLYPPDSWMPDDHRHDGTDRPPFELFG